MTLPSTPAPTRDALAADIARWTRPLHLTRFLDRLPLLQWPPTFSAHEAGAFAVRTAPIACLTPPIVPQLMQRYPDILAARDDLPAKVTDAIARFVLERLRSVAHRTTNDLDAAALGTLYERGIYDHSTWVTTELIRIVRAWIPTGPTDLHPAAILLAQLVPLPADIVEALFRHTRGVGGLVARWVQHPNATGVIWREAAALDLTGDPSAVDVQYALADHPVARRDPAVRLALARRTALPDILKSLCLAATGAELADLLHRLLQDHPAEAAALLEHPAFLHRSDLGPSDLASFFRANDRGIRQAAVAALAHVGRPHDPSEHSSFGKGPERYNAPAAPAVSDGGMTGPLFVHAARR